MADPVPSIGRVVHYISYGTPNQEYTSQCRPAIITSVGGWITITGDDETEQWEENDGVLHREIIQVWDREACTLSVFTPNGGFVNLCQHDEGSQVVKDFPRQPGTWHWPERAEAS